VERSRTFEDWAERYNQPALRVSATISSWLWTALFGAGVIWVAGRFLDLRMMTAFVVLAIVCGYSILAVVATRGSKAVTRAVASMIGNAFVMWFVASLVALSNERGATIFALLPVFVAGYHGWLFRLVPRQPFAALPMLAGIAGAIGLDQRHIAVFGIVTPLAAGIALTLGSVALRTDKLAEERAQLREAIDARALEDASREAQRLSTALLDVLGQNHDIGNSLAAARVNADWLHRVSGDGEELPARGELHAMATELRDSLERLARILDESRRIGQEMGPAAALQEVNVSSSVVHTANLAGVKFRQRIDVKLEIPQNLHALVRGGATNLERVLQNLLKNAFEGNGERGAGKVRVRASEGPIGFVTIEVADDGPGFSEASLREAVAAFATTKKEGGGLGLYTAERLVVASGGQLVRANHPEGGAVVRVALAKGGMP
jgi:signal transduction histidine kinase